MIIDIKGLSRAAVLAALYNNAKPQPQGLGYIHYEPGDMDPAEADAILRTSDHFDYLKGRVIKVDLRHPDHFDGRLYDRDNGAGAAQRAVDKLRPGHDTPRGILCQKCKEKVEFISSRDRLRLNAAIAVFVIQGCVHPVGALLHEVRRAVDEMEWHLNQNPQDLSRLLTGAETLLVRMEIGPAREETR